MAKNPLTISAKQIEQAVNDAKRKSAALKGVAGSPGVGHIGPPIFGYILRDAGSHPASELQTLATSVAHALHPSATATTMVQDGHILIGFVETPAIVVLRD